MTALKSKNVYVMGNEQFNIDPNLSDENLISVVVEKIHRIKLVGNHDPGAIQSMFQTLRFCTRKDLLDFMFGVKDNFLAQCLG